MGLYFRRNIADQSRRAIQGVMAQNDEMALGAIEAIKSAGLKVSSFAIAGIDGVTDALEAVKRGEMASILHEPPVCR